MSKTYARVIDGNVVEVFPPFSNEEGVDVPITERFHADFVAALIEVPEGTVVNLVALEPTAAEKAATVRIARDLKLAASDWTEGRSISEEVFEKWKPYRQALRDITDQPGFPDAIDWPAAPV